jgi:hypothetical protein
MDQFQVSTRSGPSRHASQVTSWSAELDHWMVAAACAQGSRASMEDCHAVHAWSACMNATMETTASLPSTPRVIDPACLDGLKPLMTQQSSPLDSVTGNAGEWTTSHSDAMCELRQPPPKIARIAPSPHSSSLCLSCSAPDASRANCHLSSYATTVQCSSWQRLMSTRAVEPAHLQQLVLAQVYDGHGGPEVARAAALHMVRSCLHPWYWLRVH